MFSAIGKINNKITSRNITIKLTELNKGVNLFDDFFIDKQNNNIKIFDRTCDHAGGKLIHRDKKIICPVHNWEFLPQKKSYKNGIQKKPLNYEIKNDKIIFSIKEYKPEITKFNKDKESLIKIRFINHAFIILEYNNFSFATDPWALGPAFSNGWWLKKKTKEDWLEKINNCDFIYISHNHPDHLHPHTLKKISKKMKFIIPKFISGSTKVLLQDLNFENIDEFELNYEYKCKKNDLNLCILKSGDFREDSGLYFSIGKFTSLLNVDSNSINFNRLPNTTFYASSFGGGASGYPLMFDNYKTDEKKEIIKRNRNFHKILQQKNLNLVKPKYFLPYASFFEERLERDKMIKKLNEKNNIQSYEDFCNKKKIKILNTEKNDLFTFKGEKLLSKKNIKVKFYEDKEANDYLNETKKNYNKINDSYLENYFLQSGFKYNLLLFISLTDDNFKNHISNYIIDFSGKKVSFTKTSSNQLDIKFKNKTSLNKLYLKVRLESFLYVIYNKLPWEDLLIGFQCKVLRTPNVYNAHFWFHFTNNYISSKRVVSKIKCNSCSVLDQKIDTEILKNNNTVNLI